MGDKLTNIVQIYMTLPIQAGFILANTLNVLRMPSWVNTAAAQMY